MDNPYDAETTPEAPEVAFGAELRRLRVGGGLTVRQLGDEWHRAHSGIVEFECGRRLPSVEVVEQYEERFGLARGTLVARRERARSRRLEAPRDGTLGEHLDDVCPYKGLLSFDVQDSALYFGREAQVQAVLTRVADVRFVAVVGASGSGKSSFVRAGLVAGLESEPAGDGPPPRVVLLTPGVQPLDALAAATEAIGATRLRAGDLLADPAAFGRAIRPSGESGCVIVVDQLEELFTLSRDETARRCFVDALIGVWRDVTSPVSVIVALRADFYGQIATYPELSDAVVAHQTLIGPLAPEDLRRTIELPAARCGLLLQTGLAETIVEDVAGEPGMLPLLSHALLETWKRRRRLQLTLGAYREAGGVRGAIAQTAERTLQSLPEADRAIARSIFLRLSAITAGTEPTRLRVTRESLAPHATSTDATNRVLAILADARLVTLEEGTVVVAHEALIRHWARLRRWIETDRAGLLVHRHLNEAASEWDMLDRDAGALYRGARLAGAREWATENTGELSTLAGDFLAASAASEHAELDAAKRRSRRLRVLASGSAALSAIVAILAVWALAQRNVAQDRAREATSLALASAATPLTESRPDVAMLLALDAYRAKPRPEARSSAFAALASAADPGVVAILHGHRGTVQSVAFTRDGHTIASGGADKTVRLWDADTHKQLGDPLIGHTDGLLAVAFSPDGRTLASAGFDKTIRLWDTRTHQPIGAALTDHGDVVEGVAFSPDGRTLASAGWDGTVRLWSVRTRRQLGVPLTANKQHVAQVAFSPDGDMLASAGADKTIRLWSTRTHKQLGGPLVGHITTVVSVAFSPDGRTLASAGFDHTIRLWDVRTKKPRGEPIAAGNGFSNVAFSPNGRRLVSALDNETVGIWGVRTHKLLGTPLAGHTDEVTAVAFNPDGKTLASASRDETIRLWDSQPKRRLLGHTAYLNSVAFSPDGRTLASAGNDKTIRLWDVRTRQALGGPLRGQTEVASIAFSSDGRTLASAAMSVGEGTIRLWDTRTRRQLGAALRGHGLGASSLAFSPDGRSLVSGNQYVQIWDTRTHRMIGRPLRAPGGLASATGVAFSPDGTSIAAASLDGPVNLWDVRSGRHLGSLAGHVGFSHSVAFSPDGRTIASAGDDKTVRMWSARTRKQIGEPLRGHTSGVHSVTFSPDGATLASAGDDGFRLWDVRTHKEVGRRSDVGGVTSIAFSPDGRTLAYVGFNTEVRISEHIAWRSLAELEHDVCSLTGDGLSKAEWARYADGITYHRSCS